MLPPTLCILLVNPPCIFIEEGCYMLIRRDREDASVRGGGQRLAVRCNFAPIIVVLFERGYCYMCE